MPAVARVIRPRVSLQPRTGLTCVSVTTHACLCVFCYSLTKRNRSWITFMCLCNDPCMVVCVLLFSHQTEQILDHIDATLHGNSPVAFGLHPNAEIGFRTVRKT